MRTKQLIYFFASLVMILTGFNVFAQDEYNIQDGATLTYTSDYCHVYDDGGKEGGYGKHVSGKVTVTASSSDARFRIIYNTKMNSLSYKAKMIIYDGDDTDAILCSVSGNDYRRMYSSGNKVTVELFTDDDESYDGIDVLLEMCQCVGPTDITYTSIDENTVKIEWIPTIPGDVTWTVDIYTTPPSLYGGDSAHFLGDLSAITTLKTKDNYVIVEGLEDYWSWVYVDIYGNCGGASGCGNIRAIPNKPDCDTNVDGIFYDTVGDTVKVWWTSDIENATWYISSNLLDKDYIITTDYHWEYPFECSNEPITFIITGDTKSDGTPMQDCKREIRIFRDCPCLGEKPDIKVDFDDNKVYFTDTTYENGNSLYVSVNYGSIQEIKGEQYELDFKPCASYSVRISYGPADTNVKFCTDEDGNLKYYDTVLIFQRCGEVFSLSVTDITAHTATINWEDEDSTLRHVVKRLIGSSTVSSDTVEAGLNSFTMTDLDNYTNYNVIVYRVCEDGKISCGRVTTFTTLYDDCINFVNMFNSVITKGDYDNPYKDSIGMNYAARISLKTDRFAKDIVTKNALKLIPEGEKASIMLGNNSGGIHARSISYDYTVDTNVYDMIILKYAVVLQDPDHTKENQPRFVLDILDDEGNLIDEDCGHEDFYAVGDLGWNEVENSTAKTIWKDWTTLGVDIAQYHGKTIKIRLTTYNCADGGHYGYAYFTIGCGTKKLYSVTRCDKDNYVYLTAPEGFEYAWYTENGTEKLSEDRELFVEADQTKYRCELNFVGKPECNFTLYTQAIAVKPIAKAHYTIDSCLSTITFTSEAYVENNYENIIYNNQTIDSIVWITDDGETFTGPDFTKEYSDNGDHQVKMIIRMSDSQCKDSLTIDLPINFNMIKSLEGDTATCIGKSVVLTAELTDENAELLWSNGQTTPSITVTPTENPTTYTVSAKKDGECKGQKSITIHVNESYYQEISADICSGEYYKENGFNENKTGVYTNNEISSRGCDSVTVLNLTVHDSYDSTIIAQNCGEIYTDNGFNVTESGFYVQKLQSQYGCDSIIHLNFTYVEPFVDTIYEEIYSGQKFNFNGQEFTESGTFNFEYTDQYGCDSIIVLDLTVGKLQFPKVITPNGDDINDIFKITGLLEQGMFEEVTLMVYNRYGRQIYFNDKFNSESDFWDPAATNTPDGTYFYRFIAKGKTKNIDFTGSVEVLREH